MDFDISKGLFLNDGCVVRKKRLTFHRLHGRDGQLWSFGVDHMTKFDGKKWTAVPIPVR